MKEKNFVYPATPANVPPATIEPSPAFKRHVGHVLGSIGLFFVVYVLLFVLSIALVIGSVYAGFAVITHMASFLGIVAGLGLVGLGVMVFIFLVKFLFAVSRFDRSQSLEVTESEQPELFAFIRQVARDTQTFFPKKIYLSPDVNACVFYDSSFWSMFLPIKKNLQIGLGLVNSINVSEFKAVIAHEFGHFSQRSMKLGSFVYNVNRIIHNMLFENSGYSNALGNWASLSDVFALFATITAQIARGIQYILRQMYGFINKSYMSLSREMEFHADAVAASVSGSKSLVTALRRIELSDAGYNLALQKCDELFKEKKVSANIYQNHMAVLGQLATEHKLNSEYGIPVVTRDFVSNTNKSRINFKDQWASHPSIDDREAHLLQLSIDAEIITEPAWILFRDKEQLQVQLTQKIYEQAAAGNTELVVIDDVTFEKKLVTDIEKFNLPEAYNGFYDGRLVEIPGEDTATDWFQPGTTIYHLEELCSAENSNLHKRIRSLTSDLEILKAIANKNIETKSFDFDGRRYERDDADAVVLEVEKELEELSGQLRTADRQAIGFFVEKAKAKGEGEVLQTMYKEYFDLRKKADDYLAHINKMLESMSIIYSGQTIPIEQIRTMINDVKEIYEPVWKKKMKEWIDLGVYDDHLQEKARLRKFVDGNYEYFSGSSFFENEINELNELCSVTWSTINQWLFQQFRAILEKQLTWVDFKKVA